MGRGKDTLEPGGTGDAIWTDECGRKGPPDVIGGPAGTWGIDVGMSGAADEQKGRRPTEGNGGHGGGQADRLHNAQGARQNDGTITAAVGLLTETIGG